MTMLDAPAAHKTAPSVTPRLFMAFDGDVYLILHPVIIGFVASKVTFDDTRQGNPMLPA